MCIDVHVCLCKWRSKVSTRYLLQLHSILIKVFCWTSSSLIDWLASKPQGSSCLHLPKTWIVNLHAWLFLMWVLSCQTWFFLHAWQAFYLLSHLPSPMFLFFKKNSIAGDWRIGSAGKSKHCSCRGPSLVLSTHDRQFTTPWNPSSQRLWPPGLCGTVFTCIHPHRDTVSCLILE